MNRLKKITLTALAATCLAAAALQAATPAAAQPPTGPSLNIVTANAMFLRPFVEGNWQNTARANMLGGPGNPIPTWLANRDVVVFQEMFDSGPVDQALNNLKSMYPYRTPIVGNDWFGLGWDETVGLPGLPENGGVVIVSKWPIVTRKQLIFPPGCGTDALANKGVAYVEITTAGGPVHVFGTHLQAGLGGPGTCESATRANQLTMLYNFKQAQNIPASEPVIYAGDFNIDRYDTRDVIGPLSEYSNMIFTLAAVLPNAFVGNPYTFDTFRNDLAAFRYPGELSQWLDYILYDYDHAHRPASHNRALAVTVPLWTAQGRTFTSFSDHYPLEFRSQPVTYSNQTDFGIQDFQTTQSPLSISGVTNPVGQPNHIVYVRIVHTWVSDLRITLIAPNNAQFVLHDHVRFDNPNIDKYYTVNISGVPSVNGIWKLRVEDTVANDTGYLDEWMMFF